MMLRKGLYEVVPAPFIEKVILFLLNYLVTLFENQLNINGLFLDSQFCSIDLHSRISILKAPQVIPCTFSAENHLVGVGSLDGLIGREHNTRWLEYFITGI